MSSAALLEVFDRLPRTRILVVGDLLLDRYTWGNAERLSPEAPVVVLNAGEREDRLGGAANVAHMLHALEAEVVCAGVTGCDAAGDSLRNLLEAIDVDTSAVLVDPTRPTTLKERFLGKAAARHSQQILRVDTESREALASSLEADLIRRIQAELPRVSAVLVSDYGKGICSPRLLRAVIDGARAAGAPVLVDPIRARDYGPYRGATLLTPNRVEAEMGSGHKVRTAEDAIGAAHELCRRLALEATVVTLDSDGMVVAWSDGRAHHFATRKRAVYDITGAGDMVLAMLGICLAGGAGIDDAVRLGNVAGGLEVEQVGVVALTREEIRRDLIVAARTGVGKLVAVREIGSLMAAARSRGQRIVFTNGCFDLLHAGHVAGLAEAADQGDRLVVGLNSDASVRRLKGPQRPVIGQAERAAMLAALASVDYVVLFDDETPAELIHQVRPDVLVKGISYAHKRIAGQEFVESYGGRVHLAHEVQGWSTTSLIERLAATNQRHAA